MVNLLRSNMKLFTLPSVAVVRDWFRHRGSGLNLFGAVMAHDDLLCGALAVLGAAIAPSEMIVRVSSAVGSSSSATAIVEIRFKLLWSECLILGFPLLIINGSSFGSRDCACIFLLPQYLAVALYNPKGGRLRTLI